MRLKPGLEDYITEYCDISDSNKGHVPSSSTYRDVLQSVAVNPSDIRKLVEIGVEYDHLIALLHGTLDVRNLSSLAQTVIHYQPTASHAASLSTHAGLFKKVRPVHLIAPVFKTPQLFV